MRSGSTRETKRRKGGKTTAGPAGAQGESAPDQTVNREGAGDGERSLGMALAFSFNGQKVRTVIEAGETWFVAADVCAVLGHANPRNAISRLDEDEKGVGNADTLVGEQGVTTVNESGLYDRERQEVWGGSNERLLMVRLLQCSSARSAANTPHFLMLPYSVARRWTVPSGSTTAI